MDYAIVCLDGHLCRLQYCIPASWWYHRLVETGVLSDRSSSGGADKSVMPSAPIQDGARLVPNPTTGIVDVVGVSGDVQEVLVMDMCIQQLVTYREAARFDVSSLPSGVYIVRVIAKEENSSEKVYYLKMVKK